MSLSFGDFCRLNGLLLRGDPIMDGKIHRVPTAAHPLRKNGWYVFSPMRGRCQAFDMDPHAHSWTPDGEARDAIRPEDVQRWKDLAAIERAETEKLRQRASHKAHAIIEQCTYEQHPYLARKGFPNERGLVLPTTGELIVPMRDARNYRNVLSVQRIDAEGGKKFLFGGQSKHACFVLGAGDDVVLCEGYATALSIRAALASLYRQARVAICYSAGNIGNVASALQGRRKVVIADHDPNGVGAKAAQETGLRWGMPPQQGHDFNDWHQAHACIREPAALVLRLLTEG